MPETIFAKLAGFLWEAIKGLAVIVVGMFAFFLKKQDKAISELQKDVSDLKSRAVFKEDLDVKAKEIEARVAAEHQRIYDKVSEAVEVLVANQNRSNDQLREDLNACNRAVMDQIHGPISEQITEIRNYFFNHIERRKTERT